MPLYLFTEGVLNNWVDEASEAGVCHARLQYSLLAVMIVLMKTELYSSLTPRLPYRPMTVCRGCLLNPIAYSEKLRHVCKKQSDLRFSVSV